MPDQLQYEQDNPAQRRLSAGCAGFVFDGSDATATKTALAAAHQISNTHASQIQAQRLERRGLTLGQSLPLEVRAQVWYNSDLEDGYFVIPGPISSILYMITAL